MIPTVIKVFLSDDPSSGVDVPITPNTTAVDVVDCCKEPGETNCHLAEIWSGNERPVSASEKPYEILQQWDTKASEVRFYLRHFDSKTNNNNQQRDWESSNKLNPGYIVKDGRIMTPNGVDMTLKELKETAQKQQQQIEMQQQNLVGKEQRLRFLKHQVQQQQAAVSENEKLRRLREKAEAQEAKLRKIRALRGKVDQQRYENTTMSSELEAVRMLFEEKHIELSVAMSKVQELGKQLDDLRKGKFLSNNNSNNTSFAGEGGKGSGGEQKGELDRLKKEMTILNRMNEDQQKRLDEQRSVLKKRNEDASDLDRRIEELSNRLRQKKLAGVQGKVPGGSRNSAPNSSSVRMHTAVAAVEPVVKQPDKSMANPVLKHSSTAMYGQNLNYQPTAHNAPKSGQGIVGRIDQAPVNGVSRGQPEGVNNPYNQYPPGHNNRPPYYGKQGNRDFYNKAMPPSNSATSRSQSAMAQYHPESSSKSDPNTAKVRPIFAGQRTLSDSTRHPYYYPPGPKSAPPQSPKKSSAGTNIFAYKSPSAASSKPEVLGYGGANVTVLPNGNIRYAQSPYPPAYTTPIPEHSQANAIVSVEMLRRKLAHAPRPLKKRSSITEPERPQGPSIPKLYFDQLYKKADTPFYRLPSDQAHRSTPPPAYIEPSKPPPPPFKPRPSKESISDTGDAISYESNLTPTEFLKQQRMKQERTDVTHSEKKASVVIEEEEEDSDLVEDDRRQEEEESASNDDETTSDHSYDDFPPPPMPSLSLVPTKGILKPRDAASKGANRHIKFDPLALLLDASLEGEFELVKKIIDQVDDASGANDEGITALHNAVCAGHFDLVKFLVHYGSDINAADTDGWTPLHCSASCNNLPMCRFLVENGACIFAATLSDRESAADKCEELDEGFLPCSEYLFGCQEKLGVARQGQVYALYDYEAANDDELSFRDGDLLTVLRKGDENESEWWWARLNDQDGYIPRNLIGIWPRIKPYKDEQE